MVGGGWEDGGRVVGRLMENGCRVYAGISSVSSWSGIRRPQNCTVHNELAQAAQLCSISIWLTTTGIPTWPAGGGVFGRGRTAFEHGGP